ncbi:Fatty acid synthase [Mizuhopecten yessoensis]|uniref:Fatty acid synthase n=2 Tax=Mizuhopecten yessoensis TaxID=6573 RepID=A0A210QSY4_MIZYE|nr:Fatty acid synthase [Mizuhopecten yessoensis]
MEDQVTGKDGDPIVISGISCRLPGADNMAEFRESLWQGENNISENKRWTKDLPDGTPNKMGILGDLGKFDAGFFGVNPKVADVMDPQLRMLLEITHEAIVDAGVEPHQLKGSDTGVYVACGLSENMEAFSTNQDYIYAYNPIGNAPTMFANRISFAFDFKGASYALRNGHASGLVALDRGLMALRTGQCQAAVVAGCNLCLKVTTSTQLHRNGLLSSHDVCNCFDEKADGLVRSEGVVAMFLQKKSSAKRIYSTVLHTKVASYRSLSPMLPPSVEEQTEFLKKVYQEAGVPPEHVAYIETSGCSVAKGEAQEMKALARVFSSHRSTPLLIGSVVSNIGHMETVSDLVGLAKLILTMEEDIIPPNLHLHTANRDLATTLNGQVQVVEEKTRLPGNSGIVALNSYGLGNLCAHAVFAAHDHQKSKCHPAEKLSRLFTYSARTKEGLESVFRLVQSNASNIHLQYLLQETTHVAPTFHPMRGYTLVNAPDKLQEIKDCSSAVAERPLWLVYSGMGSQWPGMGRTMMKFEVFRRSIERCDAVLQKHGLQLLKLIMEGEENTYESVLHSFVGLASIQVALTDMLLCMGIKPDGILGHSVGELGCGYADGSLTAEETVLAAYWRGRCVEEAKLPPGGMAAVGLTWKEAKDQCPKDVVPACHNATSTVTVSGPVTAVANFVDELKGRGVFARQVNSAGVAFHSQDMKKVAPLLKSRLSKVIKPKPRSSKWISSSVPESEWDSEKAKWSSPEYVVNNLVSPVLFQEALQHIPENACVIEIAPHCLLQAVIKRSLPKSCSIFGVMKKLHENNQEFFFSNLGKCYLEGVRVNPLGLFPAVQLPVPRGTPMISPAIRWDHNQTWAVADPENFITEGLACLFEIDLSPESKYHFMVDHRINGLDLFPASGYLTLAWRALARVCGQLYTQLPVSFTNVVFHRATILPKSGKLTFRVNLTQVTGCFEISQDDGLVASGVISPAQDDPKPDAEDVLVPQSPRRRLEPELTTDDIYKELRLRGYDFGPKFRSIAKTSCRGEQGDLVWTNNWVLLLDAMIQIHLVVKPDIKSALPTGIRRLTINPVLHNNAVLLDSNTGKTIVKVFVNKFGDTTTAGGATMEGVTLTKVNLRPHDQTVALGEMTFVSYRDTTCRETLPSLVKYTEQCSRVAAAILNKFESHLGESSIPNKKLFEVVAKSCKADDISNLKIKSKDLDRMDWSLLRTLMKVSTMRPTRGLADNIVSVLEAFGSDMEKDQLLNHMTNKAVLNPCLDIVSENLSAGALSVLEVKNIDNIFGEKLRGHLQQTQRGAVSFHQVDWTLGEASKPDDPFQLVVIDDFLHGQPDIAESLRKVSAMVAADGYLLLLEVTHNFHIQAMLDGLMKSCLNVKDERTLGWYCSPPKWQELFKMADLEIIVEKADSLLYTLYLLKKRTKSDPKRQTVVHVDHLNFSWLDDLKTKFKEVQTRPKGDNLWLVADKEKRNGILGLVRCLRREPGGERVRCVFHADGVNKACEPTPGYLEGLMERDLVMNVYKEGVCGSYRQIPPKSVLSEIKMDLRENKNVEVRMKKYGDMSSFCWSFKEPSRLDVAKDESKVLCHIVCVALNTADRMIATGKLVTGEPGGTLCTEFSGFTPDGRRVMGLAPNQALSKVVLAEKDLIWDIPETWSHKEAATVIWAYGLAIYALKVRGNLTKDACVLIHDAACDVGQAAVAIALSYSTNIYVTVKMPSHKDMLSQHFPRLSEDRIFLPHQSNNYEADILRATKGKGVSMVLTSQMADNLQSDIRLLQHGGKLLDLNTYIPSDRIPQGTIQGSYELLGIRIESLKEMDMPSVAEMIQQGIQNNTIKPLPFTTYPPHKLKEAFDAMTTEKGSASKILVEMVPSTPSKNLPGDIPLLLQCFCPANKSYIITGGLGGFGIELAQWLIDNGARNIILVSRSGVKNSYQARKLLLWKDEGITVRISNDDIRTRAGTKDLFDEARSFGEVAGVFHLAMVLKDGLFENQSMENYKAVCEAKIDVVLNLDLETKARCKDSLDWFVVFSSVSSGFGNAGQTNYGFANAVMERVCEERKAEGLPGLAIQWGAIGDVGVASDKTVVGGTLPQRLVSCLEVLGTLLHQSHPVVSSYVPAQTNDLGPQAQGQKQDITTAVLQIIGIQPGNTPSPDKPLVDIGLDSLMLAEIKQLLDHEFDLSISVDEIRTLTIRQLKKMLKEELDSTVLDTNVENSSAKVSITRDDLVATHTIKRLNDVDNDRPAVFIIHSLGGTVSSLSDLVSSVSAPLYGVQLTTNVPAQSIQTIAAHYLQEIDSLLPDKPYHLVGVSFGCLVAMEMRHQLEKFHTDSKNIGKLVLVDGSPSIVPQLYGDEVKALRSLSRHAQETNTITSFIESLTGETAITKTLTENKSFDSKIQEVTSHLTALQPQLLAEDIAMATRIYHMLSSLAVTLMWRSNIKGDVTLLRPLQPSPDYCAQHQDYGLKQYVDGRVNVVSSEFTHKNLATESCQKALEDILVA